MNKTLTGIHVVEKKYSLIWLRDNEKQLSQTMKYFDFVAILHQSFNEQQIKKILEALNCEERLLIDFDKEKVKIINKKEEDFSKEMNKYMTAKTVQDIIDNTDNFNWLTFGIEYKKD